MFLVQARRESETERFLPPRAAGELNPRSPRADPTKATTKAKPQENESITKEYRLTQPRLDAYVYK